MYAVRCHATTSESNSEIDEIEHLELNVYVALAV
jgi:hypothetical protein